MNPKNGDKPKKDTRLKAAGEAPEAARRARAVHGLGGPVIEKRSAF